MLNDWIMDNNDWIMDNNDWIMLLLLQSGMTNRSVSIGASVCRSATESDVSLLAAGRAVRYDDIYLVTI